MGYKATFNGWSHLTIEDLLVVYRKAKADCFFENTFPTAIKFSEYEQDLLVDRPSEKSIRLFKREFNFDEYAVTP